MRSSHPIQKVLSASFNNPELLREALTHTSYVNEQQGAIVSSNERLEFLGDALVDLIIAEALFLRYPGMSAGDLTAMRSALVSGDALALVAERLNLGEALFLGQGEEAGGGRSRLSNLAAVFEAVVGAIFLDRGFEEAKGWVLGVMAEDFEELSHRGVPKDPKSMLQEVVQGMGRAIPLYRMVEERGPDHAREFVIEVVSGGEVLGSGSGHRKLEAEREAARAALQRLGKV